MKPIKAFKIKKRKAFQFNVGIEEPIGCVFCGNMRIITYMQGVGDVCKRCYRKRNEHTNEPDTKPRNPFDKIFV